jgi:cell division septation protein DedD
MSIYPHKLFKFCFWAYLCLFIVGNAPIFAQNSIIFCIQLGVLKNAGNINAAALKNIGELHTEDAGEGRTRVLLGKFDARSEAEKALILVSQQGYSEAFIVVRNAPSSNANTTAPNNAAPTKPPTLPEKIFLVQIGAYNETIPPDDLAKAVLHGSVYSEKVGNLTKVYIGTYNTAEHATEATHKIRLSGLSQAFKREMPSALLSQMTLVKEARITIPNANTAATPKIPATPILFGDKTALLDDVNMFNNGSKNDTIAIDGHILPISAQECLFIGTLDPYNSDAYQPLLLRTNDGGKSWAEVMQSEYGNSINSIQFVGKKTIFLTTMWVIEGPGEVNLFRSDDAGKTWRKVSKIPRDDFFCVSNYLHFSDANKGKIVYTCSDDEYLVWETIDGGVKWKSKGKISPKDFKKLKNNNILDYSLKPSYTAINDNTISYKQINTPDVIIIQKRDSSKKAFKEASRLLRWYRLDKNNQIVPR